MGASGTATLDFGAFPGASDTSVAVTGQTDIVAGSLVEAWLRPEDTADHSADEHLLEEIKVLAGNIVAGTGFTIYGICTARNVPRGDDTTRAGTQRAGPAGPERRTGGADTGGGDVLLYGTWTIAWVWN